MSPGLFINEPLPVAIIGSAAAFPAKGRWMTNESIHEILFGKNWNEIMVSKKLDPKYYEKQLGFKNRYWVHQPGTEISHDELTSSCLMQEAGALALEDAKLSPRQVDFVIAVTITSPKYSTSMGPYIAGKLNISAPAIEIKSGCASNIYAIILAAQLIRSGAKNVLIAGGETNTKTLPMHPRTAYAGGDGGGAIVLSQTTSAGKGIVAAFVNSDGSYSGHMGVPGLLPPNQKDLDEKNYYLQYSETAEDFLNQVWRQIPKILYQHINLTGENINCFIPHQVHKKRMEYAISNAGLSADRTIDVIEKYANCGSVSLLLAINEARRNGRLLSDQKVLIAAAGGGISWGGMILQT